MWHNVTYLSLLKEILFPIIQKKKEKKRKEIRFPIPFTPTAEIPLILLDSSHLTIIVSLDEGNVKINVKFETLPNVVH